MFPTSDQIERTAYHNWLARGQTHGRDRQDWLEAEKELRFRLNYRIVVEFALDSDVPKVLGERPVRRCRFCERTSNHVEFAGPRPVVPALAGSGSLFTDEVCDECHAECLEPLEDDLGRFWKTLRPILSDGDADRESRGRNPVSVAAFKSLIAGAFLVVPDAELTYFPDALEWLTNPDHDCDASLFHGMSCQVYDAPFSNQRAWIVLARRLDNDAPLPYMIAVVGSGGIVLEVPLPLCLRDEDLDGRMVSLPDPPLMIGDYPAFAETRRVVLALGATTRPSRQPSALLGLTR
jgi:Protein of unknown function (DUF2934)